MSAAGSDWLAKGVFSNQHDQNHTMSINGLGYTAPTTSSTPAATAESTKQAGGEETIRVQVEFG